MQKFSATDTSALATAFDTIVAASNAAAEKALTAWDIRYQKRKDGTLVVPGDLNIGWRGLTALPDLSRVIVRGDFNCRDNKLTSLKGAPQSVEGSFHCGYNRLKSLEGAPQSLSGDFRCNDNKLTTLKGAPRKVGGSFFCDSNQLTSLEHAPEHFGRLGTPFGEFSSWQAVPQNLRISPETLKRQEQELLTAATVLQAEMTIRRPLKLQKGLGLS